MMLRSDCVRVCKWHDVPKRTEDIHILYINFYPQLHRSGFAAAAILCISALMLCSGSKSRLNTIRYFVPFAPTERQRDTLKTLRNLNMLLHCVWTQHTPHEHKRVPGIKVPLHRLFSICDASTSIQACLSTSTQYSQRMCVCVCCFWGAACASACAKAKRCCDAFLTNFLPRRMYISYGTNIYNPHHPHQIQYDARHSHTLNAVPL